jgi:PPOX class probable F420-dependent enzyme
VLLIVAPGNLTGVTDTVLPDASTPFGDRVRRRLRDEQVVWLTTVDGRGAPQPNPVWFVWDGETFLTYNRADARRLVHVRARPDVSLNLNSRGGGDIVVILGRADVTQGEPAPHEQPLYLGKYRDDMIHVSGSPEAFSEQYPVPMRIRPRRVRGF